MQAGAGLLCFMVACRGRRACEDAGFWAAAAAPKRMFDSAMTGALALQEQLSLPSQTFFTRQTHTLYSREGGAETKIRFILFIKADIIKSYSTLLLYTRPIQSSALDRDRDRDIMIEIER